MGQTPYAVNFGKTFNDPNSPWMFAVTDALFGSPDTLRRHNDEITRSLAEE
jgi:multiple sugar transport system substrate-binding protein